LEATNLRRTADFTTFFVPTRIGKNSWIRIVILISIKLERFVVQLFELSRWQTNIHRQNINFLAELKIGIIKLRFPVWKPPSQFVILLGYNSCSKRPHFLRTNAHTVE